MNPTIIRLVIGGSSEPRTWLSQRAGEFALIVLVCLSVLSPNLYLSQTLPMIRFDLVALPLVAGTFVWFLLVGQTGKLRITRLYLIGGLFSLSVTLSLLYGTGVLHNSLQFSDFYEISKAWLPVAFFVVGYEARLSEKGINRLLNALAVVALVICFMGWAQFLNLPFAPRIQAIYGDGGHNDRALLLFHRIYSTLTNPNILGEFLSWTLVGYFLAFLYQTGNRFRNVCVSLCCLVTLTLTGSRYGILSACLGMLIVLWLARQTVRRSGRGVTLVLLLLLFVGAFAGIQRISYFTSQRFQELRDPTQVNSLRGRLDDLWVVAADYFVRSPILGQGPAKRIFDEAYTDSEYLDILKKFGLVGFSIYLAFYFWPLWKLRMALRWQSQLYPSLGKIVPANLFAVRFGVVLLCMALFMNIGMYTCFNWYLMCLLWSLTGVTVRSAEVVQEVIVNLAFAPVAALSPEQAQASELDATHSAGNGLEYA